MGAIVEEHRRLISVFGSGDVADMAREINQHIDVEIHKVNLENIIAQRRSEASVAAKKP